MQRTLRFIACIGFVTLLVPACGDDDPGVDGLLPPPIEPGIYAVSTTNNLLSFTKEDPTAILGSVAITGLQAGESVLAIDFRPATQSLYALGSTSRLYTLDLGSGAATQAGAAGSFVLSGTAFGFDVNPVADRIRVVSDADQNMRLDPNDGTLTAVDVALTYSGGDPNLGEDPNVVASAYTNNFAGAASTALYGIDSNLDILVIQNLPNAGILSTVGPLGVDMSELAGLDITAGGAAYASSTGPGGASSLYRIDLVTGAATVVAAVGGGQTVRDIALVEPVETLYAVDDGDNLIGFTSDSPETIRSTVSITGLDVGESILAIDFRPATGSLYALGSSSRLYTLNAATGAATQVGAPGGFPALSGTAFGFDVNPVADRIRVVGDADQNMRLNPSDGTLTALDVALTYSGGDPNLGANPSVVASAYSNNFVAAVTTTLYGIDSSLDILVIQNPPNAGILNTVGPLGVDTSDLAGLDLSARENAAFAVLTVGGTSRLYRIDLLTGTAGLVGPIGDGTVTARGLAIAP
jgi:hypothetical protein